MKGWSRCLGKLCGLDCSAIWKNIWQTGKVVQAVSPSGIFHNAMNNTTRVLASFLAHLSFFFMPSGCRLASLEVLSCEKTCQLRSEDMRCCLCFSDPLYFLGTANSSALVEHIPAGGEGCSQEVEEMVWPFSSGLVRFAQGALLLLSIVCGAQVLPGWQFSCIPGGFLPPRISSGAFTAQCFSTRFVPSPVFVHPMNFQMGKAASPRS